MISRKYLRELLGLTSEQMSLIVGTQKSVISLVENRKRTLNADHDAVFKLMMQHIKTFGGINFPPVEDKMGEYNAKFLRELKRKKNLLITRIEYLEMTFLRKKRAHEQLLKAAIGLDFLYNLVPVENAALRDRIRLASIKHNRKLESQGLKAVHQYELRLAWAKTELQILNETLAAVEID
jgi:hypothetical protein